MTKVIPLSKVKQEHKIECPEVSLEFFMEHYCQKLLREGKEQAIEIVVSPRFSFVFKK